MKKILIVGIVTIVIIVGIILIPENPDPEIPEINGICKSAPFYPECGNMSFLNTSVCLNRFVNQIFIYNVTDDNISLTLDDLKKRGGDCKDWTDFYERYLNLYGYSNIQRVNLFVERADGISNGHVFLVAGDKTGYCTLDMENITCFTYN